MARRRGQHGRDCADANVTSPADFAAQIPSRLVMQLADPSGYTSFGFRPIDLPRFVRRTRARPGRPRRAPDRRSPGVVGRRHRGPRRRAGTVRPPMALEERSDVTRRGDGIGLEVTTSVVRGVRLDQDEPGRVVAAAEAPISRFDDEAAVLDALVRVHGQLGGVAGIHAATTRAAWFPVGSTMQRLDATGNTGPELNSMRHDLAERAGITSTMLVETQARRWMLVLRWDHVAASRLERLLERAGFVDASVEPAPVAFGRVIGTTTPVARRDASNGHSWAAVYDAGVPIAATSVPQASREYPGIAVAGRGQRVASPRRRARRARVGRPRRRDRRHRDRIHRAGPVSCDLHLVLADVPYPPFPAHDLRAPQRQAVALGAAAGAAGLAGRLRPVDVLVPDRRPARRRHPAAVGDRAGRRAPTAGARASRRPWWRRFGPLAQSRSRKPGRSPKTATAWRSGTKSRR